MAYLTIRILLVLLSLAAGPAGQCDGADATDDENSTLELPWEHVTTFFQQLMRHHTERILLHVGGQLDSFEKEFQDVQNRLETADTENKIRFDRLETLVNESLAVCQDTRQSISDISNSTCVQVETLQSTPSCGVFLRREDGSVDFNRSWVEYQNGFGDPNGEFWLGLEALHQCTQYRNYKLRVDLVDWSGERKWAEYSQFAVGGNKELYRLDVSGYNISSTAGDGLTGAVSAGRASGMAFSTYDKDHDQIRIHCAARKNGGWWYNACATANPTGSYKPLGNRDWNTVHWLPAYNDYRSFKGVTLTLTPA